MIDLPCGLRLSNHLVKPAMEESLASYSRPLPNEALFRLYRAWAAADYGLLITGNVQVDSAYRGTPYDVCHVDEHDVSWRRWAESTRPVPCLVQLCHTGRQSPRGNGRYPWQPSLAPSAVPLRGGSTLASRFLTKLLFGTPRALTSTDMDKIVDQFARAARTMERAGFAGVQLHCRYGETPWVQAVVLKSVISHGYVLSTMLSPQVNLRTDEYGGRSAENRLRLLSRIIRAIRQSCSARFCLSVKLNCSDFVVRCHRNSDLENYLISFAYSAAD